MIFLTVTPSLTPTPIPIDQLPAEFEQHLGWFFVGLFNALKQIEIPFTSVTLFEVLIGSIAVSSITLALKLMYGKGGGGSSRE